MKKKDELIYEDALEEISYLSLWKIHIFKGTIGEDAYNESLDYLEIPTLKNIEYGSRTKHTRQKDIDELSFTSKGIILNDCKHWKPSIVMTPRLFIDKVLCSIADGLPIAEFYARMLQKWYPNNITFSLTIPCFNANSLVKSMSRGINLHIVETTKENILSSDFKFWYKAIKEFFDNLLVYNYKVTSMKNRKNSRLSNLRKGNNDKESVNSKQKYCIENKNKGDDVMNYEKHNQLCEDTMNLITKEELKDIILSHSYYDLLPIDKKFQEKIEIYIRLRRVNFNFKAKFDRYCKNCRKCHKCGYRAMAFELYDDLRELHNDLKSGKGEKETYIKFHQAYGYCLIKCLNCIHQRIYLQKNCDYNCFSLDLNTKSVKKTQKDFNHKIDHWFND